ncbi:DUF2284 domain-containing protein [Propionivibrio dicarboxylicus]|uniref:Predicted metal-binding protein n=1 Tax=Propionivibrio dicarboxylicus TaxID=83767 RepID=A0A1G7WLZ6_9RHOO|nr:DUF2284 domain-containing protein [Propionivibrio dicarboxylicus]SDG72899.1 Predicted metal-binding protein [Propionivibrio dicarboxylicus]
MRHYDVNRIQGYCRDCGMYGKFWSCPPFDSQPLAALPEWTHAVLIMWQTAVSTPDDMNALIAQFQAARRHLGEILIGCERPGTTAIIAGQCFGCSDCVRARGADCCAPARMRYSLESLGFDVSTLTEELLGHRLAWAADKTPDTLTLVGALLCANCDSARHLEQALSAR